MTTLTRPLGLSPVNTMFLMAQGLCELRASSIVRGIADTIHPDEYLELRATHLRRSEQYGRQLVEAKAWEVNKGRYAEWSEQRYQAALEMLEGVAEGIRLELLGEIVAPAPVAVERFLDVEQYRKATEYRFVPIGGLR